MMRGFCPTCGTPVTSAAEARPHQIFVRIGTLDDPNLISPQITIWTSQAPMSPDPINGALGSFTPAELAAMPVCTGKRPDIAAAWPGAVSVLAWS